MTFFNQLILPNVGVKVIRPGGMSISMNRGSDGGDFLRVRGTRERTAENEVVFGDHLYPSDLGDVGRAVFGGNDFHE